MISKASANIPAEVELILVAPQHGGPGFHYSLRKHIVQVYHLVTALVTHDHEQRTLLLLHAVLHQRPDAAIDLLPHCGEMKRLHASSQNRAVL